MALTQAVITFDVSDYASADFDARRTKVYATNNVPGGTVIDTVGNHIFLGSGTGTIATDGTGSISVPTPGTGSNPASWQTTIHIDYPDRNATSGRTVKSFGPFTITTSANLADLVAEMPVQPEYASDVLDRLDALEAGGGTEALVAQAYGYENHGDVSGSVTFNGPTASHRFTATGPTTITLAGYTEGMVATLICFSGADDVTVVDAGDVTLVDGTAWSAELAMGAWISGGGGGEPVVPDTTPPSAVTDLAVTPDDDGVTAVATFTAATDAESAVKYRYRLYPTGGTVPAWPTSGSQYNLAGSPINLTGLTTGEDYTMELQAYSAGGSAAADTATFTTPAAPPVEPTWTVEDTFTAANGTSLEGRTTPVGGATYIKGGFESQGGEGWGVITDNAIPATVDGHAIAGASVLMTSANVAGEITYDLTGRPAEEGRGYIWVSSSGETDALSVQIRGSGQMICFKGSATEITLAGVTSGIPLTGTLRVTYDAGVLTVVTAAGTATATVTPGTGFSGTGRRLGFAARGIGAKVDNFKAANL